ncbi:MAG: ornithine carbamoyltransferase [Porticoccaceae bacterium]|jgi:ornithine carbamoyltransferase|nr:ornithine carbamoyltransferase [Porticoccaceae bacterium]MBT7376261.1 ornithine carbamoyltransferase [Porticoccaceae bacterium]
MAIRHFLTLKDLSTAELHQVIELAMEMKAAKRENRQEPIFAGKVLGMIFEKSSTRTRVSFEAGMAQLGGDALFLSPNDTQLGRGEPVEDSARVISRMVDIVMIRTFDHSTVETFAQYSKVPVINALTDDYHPCQLLADIQTFTEHRGSVQGKTVAWIGDGNNMCNSWINAAMQFDFKLHIACPAGYEPSAELVAQAGDHVMVTNNPVIAATGADLVTTDVFASMGQEDEQQERLEKFAGFQVNHKLMSHAADNALFMHCLPAHREEEVSTELLEDETISVVWDEAENRLHAQKALMVFLLKNSH